MLLQTGSNLVGFSDIKSQSIEGWEQFLSEGEQFLNTGQRAFMKGNKVFTAEILYNITCMAIEKFIMAALMRHGAMPYNHTMADLVEAMEITFIDGVADLKAGLLGLDKHQEICDLDAFAIRPPQIDEIPAMLQLANGLRELAYRQIGGTA